MFDIYYYFLNYEFLSKITNICYNVFENKKSDIVEEEVNEYMEKLEEELYQSRFLYLVDNNEDYEKINSLSLPSLKSSIITYTTGKNEILNIEEIALNIINEKSANINITYIDQNKNIVRGYVLKFNNAFVICKNLTNPKSQKMSAIPLLKNINKTSIFEGAKNNLGVITNIIEYSKVNNEYYMPDDIRNIFESGFRREDVKLTYNRGILNIEYQPKLFRGIVKKYDIIILKNYDVYYDAYGFILIMQQSNEQSNSNTFINKSMIENDGLKERHEEHMRQKTINEQQQQEHLKFQTNNEILNNIQDNIFVAGLVNFIKDYLLQNKNKQILTDVLYDLSLENKEMIEFALLFNNTYEQINNSFENSFNKYIAFNKGINLGSKNTKENIKINGFEERLKNVNYVIIKKNNLDEINLDNKETFKIIEIFKYKNDPLKYCLRLNAQNSLYNFSFMKLNNDTSFIILEKNKEEYNENTASNFDLVCTKIM